MRPVPRNIDKPNRTSEYLMTFLAVYYGLMFTLSEVLIAFTMACLSVYLIYKLTLNKPEGQAYRVIYKYARFGRLLPNPKKAPKFEI